MKLRIILPAAISLSMLSGCATNESATTSTTASAATHQPAATGGERNDGQPGDWNKTPTIGMTKAEVRQRYGDPHRVTTLDGREVWEYDAKARGQDFIPIYGGFTRQTKGGSISFGPDDRVAGHKWGTRRWMY